MIKLTEKQAEVLEYIKDYIVINKFPPTRSEIAEAFEVGANAIQDRIDGLIKKGAVTQQHGKQRSTVPVKGFRVRIKGSV